MCICICRYVIITANSVVFDWLHFKVNVNRRKLMIVDNRYPCTIFSESGKQLTHQYTLYIVHTWTITSSFITVVSTVIITITPVVLWLTVAIITFKLIMRAWWCCFFCRYAWYSSKGENTSIIYSCLYTLISNYAMRNGLKMRLHITCRTS